MRIRSKIGLWLVGHTAKRIEEFLFDTVLYGTVVAFCIVHFGAVNGPLAEFAIMTPLSAYLCLMYVAFYNWAKKDWLGIEALKQLSDVENPGRISRVIQKIIRHGGLPAFFALSIVSDPFIVVTYFRKLEPTSLSQMTQRNTCVAR